MKIDEIESQMRELGYSIQDLDAQVSQMHVPEAQISSAWQLVDLQQKKDAITRKRNLLRGQSAELEKMRQSALQEAEKNRDQQHEQSTRLSRIAIWTDIVLTVLGKVVK